MERVYITTPLGITQIEGDQNGVSKVIVLEDDKVEEVTSKIPKNLEEVVIQLNEYFAGKRLYFKLKLNPKGTDFQKKVWEMLQKIPYGKTIFYLELSKRLNDKKAIRAVANANGKNPLWIIIPCHRVIGTNGSLTGYAGGLWRKKWLLEHENPCTQQYLF